MNPKGQIFPVAGNFPKNRFLLAPLLALSCALLTGCPHNDYTVELKPGTNGIERTLTFYRADGVSNGIPNYQEFSTNELAAITRVYPPGAVKPDGKRYIARGEFSGPLPGDVGGAGAYTNLATSLGDAGFYLERFRVNDDLAARTARQYAAADKITDLIIGWARTEFGHERGWKNLHQFLDKDFRHDLKNAGLYYQFGAAVALSSTNAPEEFVARFGQYLLERGYFQFADVPQLYASDGDSALALMQRLAAEKMGIPAGGPLPKSFAVLANVPAFKKSWEQYLSQTDLYRARVKEWERKKKADPNLKRPTTAGFSNDLLNGLLADLLGNNNGGETDHLTVKLALDRAPSHSNGRWQDGWVIWDADLNADRALPVLCFASWSRPATGFQEAHFGKIVLEGDDLTEYCLWFNGLNAQQAGEWEKILDGLQPGQVLKDQLDAFKRKIQPDSEGNQQTNAPPGK
jgi:hypothetical protein